VPLILAGWAYSNDVEKRDRWQETLDWADRHGVADFVNVSPKNMYSVNELSI
jgi:hypothetical protein